MDLGAAVTLAERLLAEHGLVGWTVALDRAKRRAGRCVESRRLITLSAPITELHDHDEVRETILHEIAHALVGVAHGHDEVWRAAAVRIGSTGQRCVDAAAPRVPGAWVGVCPAGHTIDRHRRPTRVASCTICRRAFDPAHLYTWTHHGRPVPMHPNYEAELASLSIGRTPSRLPVGAIAEIVAAGRYRGQRGRVVKVARTTYRLRLGDGSVLRVPFALARST